MAFRLLRVAVAIALTVGAASAFAQGRANIPVTPLPDEPWEYQTASANIRVSVLTDGLENPWSLEFLPDASILSPSGTGGCVISRTVCSLGRSRVCPR